MLTKCDIRNSRPRNRSDIGASRAGIRFDKRVCMRKALIIAALAGVAGGCASTKTEPKASVDNALVTYHPASAGALAFDPPVASETELNLSRQNLAPEAFLGFEAVTASYYYLRVDDRQYFDQNDRDGAFQRRATSYRVGASYR
jgi:hypothetical protein